MFGVRAVRAVARRLRCARVGWSETHRNVVIRAAARLRNHERRGHGEKRDHADPRKKHRRCVLLGATQQFVAAVAVAVCGCSCSCSCFYCCGCVRWKRERGDGKWPLADGRSRIFFDEGRDITAGVFGGRACAGGGAPVRMVDRVLSPFILASLHSELITYFTKLVRRGLRT